MSQHATVHQNLVRYSRTDFTALRAWVQRVPVAKIAALYYQEDAPQVKEGLERFLNDMRADFIERSILANPRLAEMLANARRGGPISLGVLDFLFKAANAQPDTPKSSDHIGRWLRAKVATRLVAEGIHTLADLKAFIEVNGASWWRPIPRLGQLRARAVVAWLAQTPALAVDPAKLLSNTAPLSAFTVDADLTASPHGRVLAPLQTTPLPLERITALPSSLDGSRGLNRASHFCYLSAKNDLQAVQAYLLKFRQQAHTERAYRRELERFLLWCVLERKTALSSVLVGDCEAYKDFLARPTPPFTGPRKGRFTAQWRPFVGPLSPESQKQAVQILRTAFNWLQAVRYLGGNPWVAVSDPRVDQALHAMQIERALPSDLFEKVVMLLSEQCQDPQATQARISLATLLLLGDCGLRISEAAHAKRAHLVPSSFTPGRYQLKVLGKRSKVRMVPVTPRAHEALLAHQADVSRHYPETLPQGEHALIRPITLANSQRNKTRHQSSGKGYAANALAMVVSKALKKIAQLEDVTVDELIKLNTTSAHGLRHTFGTTATQREMPLDVVQAILGHASIGTTSIYIRAQERRVAEEAEKLVQRGSGQA